MEGRSQPVRVAFCALSLVIAFGCGRRADVPARVASVELLRLRFDGSCVDSAGAARVTAVGVDFAGGVAGAAARFDGTGAHVDVEGVGRLALHDEMTLEFWFNADDWRNPYAAGAAAETMVSLSDFFMVSIARGEGWTLDARLTTEGSEKPAKLRAGTVTPDTWHHVALDYRAATGQARLWLDGEVVAEKRLAGKLAIRNPLLPLRVGTWFEKNLAFCGLIDDVRLWNRVLADEELLARQPHG